MSVWPIGVFRNKSKNGFLDYDRDNDEYCLISEDVIYQIKHTIPGSWYVIRFSGHKHNRWYTIEI